METIELLLSACMIVGAWFIGCLQGYYGHMSHVKSLLGYEKQSIKPSELDEIIKELEKN